MISARWGKEQEVVWGAGQKCDVEYTSGAIWVGKNVWVSTRDAAQVREGSWRGGCGQHRLERVLKVYERCYTRGQGVWAGSVGKGCFGVMEVCKRSPTCQVRYGEVSQEESIGVRVV